MVALLAAAALTPWAHPPSFRPAAGWQSGASGAFSSTYGPAGAVASPQEATAWTVKGVRYRDRRTADPPTATLSRFPPGGILVFAAVYQSARRGARPIVLRLDRAQRYPCCDGTHVAGGEYGLAGSGPGGVYSVAVRVYFGSPPTPGMRRDAQRALDRLRLPRPRNS